MPIAVRCRLCGRPYNLADRYAGRVVRCTECQAAIEVPQPAAPRRAAPVVAHPVAAPKPSAAPAPLAAIVVAPAPASALPAGPPSVSPLFVPRKKKKSNVPVILVAVGAGALSLTVVVAIGLVAVGKLVPALLSFSLKSRRSAPFVYPTATYRAPSNARQFEELLQKLLSALQRFNGVLAQIVDGASARRQADQVLACYNELMSLRSQILGFTPHFTAEEDRRLESTYRAPLRSAGEQLKMHALRVRQIQDVDLAFGGRFRFDDLHERMGMLHGPRFGFGPNSGVAFQPPTQPSFRPPQPPVTHPPMTGPQHSPFNHGMRGPGAMHGRRGR